MPPDVSLQFELAIRLLVAAALGVAVGAGEYAVGAVGTAIVLFSLWPLNRVADRIRAVGRSDSVRMRLQVASLESLGSITRQLSSQRIETSGLATSRAGAAYEVEMELKVRSGSGLAGAVEAISKLEGVEVMETSPP